MNGFISYANSFRELLQHIISSEELHAKWLNTLSYLENCGARKIAACEHPFLVKEEMLKHAAEEFRHAHHFKRQIEKVSAEHLENYSFSYLIGGFASWQYLPALDLKTCRYLSKNAKFQASEVREAAYLLVTYAIELRASELYSLYDEILRKQGSKVSVKSILLEEKEHLHEMQQGIASLSNGFLHAEKVCLIESEICKKWIDAISSTLYKFK